MFSAESWCLTAGAKGIRCAHLDPRSESGMTGCGACAFSRRHPQLPQSSSPTWLKIHNPRTLRYSTLRKHQKHSLRSPGSPIGVGDDVVWGWCRTTPVFVSPTRTLSSPANFSASSNRSTSSFLNFPTPSSFNFPNRHPQLSHVVIPNLIGDP